MNAVARRAGVTFGFLPIAVLALTIGCKAMPMMHYYLKRKKQPIVESKYEFIKMIVNMVHYMLQMMDFLLF